MKFGTINKKSYTLLVIVIFLTTALTISISSTRSEDNYLQRVNDNVINALTPSGSITITSDADFVTYDFDGQGTEISPYIIADLDITPTETYGIFVEDTTKYFVIEFNQIIGASEVGIVIDNITAGTAVVLNNTCESNGAAGIVITGSNNILVSQNICNNNGNYGIYLLFCSNFEVFNNTCNGNTFGIALQDSSSCTLADNIGLNNGDSGVHVHSGCSYIEIYGGYYSGSVYGIEMYGADNCTITGNILINNNDGIYLDGAESARISWNNASMNSNAGIYLNAFSDFCTIEQNQCWNNFIGIQIANSDEIIVTRNTAVEIGGEGISVMHADFLNVTFNNFTTADTAIYQYYSYNCSFSNNLCVDSRSMGYYGNYAESNKITYNLIQGSTSFGVYLDSNAKYYVVHHNAFIDNIIAGSQAFDDGVDNIWYEVVTLEGNWWSDYVGPGTYYIDGTSGNYDLYPLNAVPIIPEFSGNLTPSYILLFISMFSFLGLISKIILKKK